MDNECCDSKAAGCETCELPSPTVLHLEPRRADCPVCGGPGKRVAGQTVKALLAVTLRQVGAGPYFFCKTPTCPVVFFSQDGAQTFTTDQVRERVYQKEPDSDSVPICYCFRHTAGEVRSAAQGPLAILDDINAGIAADQCACDIRNPQGSCCLGNVRSLIKASSALSLPKQ